MKLCKISKWSNTFSLSLSLSLSLFFFFLFFFILHLLIYLRILHYQTSYNLTYIYKIIYNFKAGPHCQDRGIDNAWAYCAKHLDADTLPKWRCDVVNYGIILWNIAPAINLACHSHCLYHAGNDSYKQYCLFKPVICLYIIVLLKHAL